MGSGVQVACDAGDSLEKAVTSGLADGCAHCHGGENETQRSSKPRWWPVRRGLGRCKAHAVCMNASWLDLRALATFLDNHNLLILTTEDFTKAVSAYGSFASVSVKT